MKPSFFVGLVFSVLLCAVGGHAANLHGGGGSAIYPVMSLWTEDYARKTGVTVNYQMIGSGGGIRQSLARTIDFGNTDKPLDHATLAHNKLAQFPILIIAIVPVVNLPGIKPGEVMLDGPTLARIYLGEIKRWDDAAIVALNPGVPLPKLPIVVIHRADGSGTTFHFTSYLSKVSPQWKAQVGADTAVEWPLGSAARGNAGVVATLEQTRGGIAYVEYAYAQQNGLTVVGLVNREAGRVVPGEVSFKAAADQADFARPEDFRIDLTDLSGRQSWPIMAVTYLLVRTDAEPGVNAALAKFVDYAFTEGRGAAAKLHYVSLPPQAAERVKAALASQLRAKP